ncbi:hypothetical protein AB0L99_22615 [Streptomyces sp. NPDC051954]|uniref:hypothetical protein n=1 Tax=Streptomyces sp. NPDC051954 TaxID=3155524 RepID=UPI0034392483
MRRMFSSACASVAIVTATTAGCTAAAEHGGQGRELTATEEVVVRRAEQLLVKECMEKKGFKYWVGALPTVDDLKGDGFFLTDVGWAKRNGYGSRLQKKAQNVQRDDPNSAYAKTLPREERARYSDTLLGSTSSGMLTADLPVGGAVQAPRDSCLADAKGRLYGDFETWFRAEKTATNLTPLYQPDLVKDRRFTDAVKKWSACMRVAGHDYAKPSQVREKLTELTEGLSEEKAYAVEVDLAVAEATCANETPLARTTRTLETEYREKQLPLYGDDIATYERMSLDALAQAEEITGSTA